MGHVELEYKPLKIDDQGNIGERDYELYLTQPSLAKVAKELVISPLEEAMKNDGRDVFKFSTFKVSVSQQNKTNVSWEVIHSRLSNFLDIRSQDARDEKESDDFRKFEGVGYCIAVDSLEDEIRKLVRYSTSSSRYQQLYWPKRKEDEFVRELIIPDSNFSEIKEENARLCLAAKRFVSSLKEEICEAYDSAMSGWMTRETGCDKDNIPPKELSPVKRLRKISRGKYIFISHVREEVPKYQEIINGLINDLADIRSGEAVEGYKYTSLKGRYFVNIGNVINKVSIDKIHEDRELFGRLYLVKLRCEITPKLSVD